MTQPDQSPTTSRNLVRIERFDEPALAHVAELVLDRPEALNAVSTAMAGAIRDATQQLAGDDTVRCVLLTSSHEKAFCVGADLKERNTLTDAELVDVGLVDARSNPHGVRVDDVDQALLSEHFAVGVFRLRDSVRVANQEVARLQHHLAFLVGRKWKRAHDRAVDVEYRYRVLSNQNRRQMSCIRVRQGPGYFIEQAEKESRIFFRRGMSVELLV